MKPRCTRAAGFTLLEALVTLVLLATLVSVVFPNMQRWYDRMQARQSLAQVLTQLKQLGAVAVAHARDLGLADVAGARPTVAATYRLTLPAQWRLQDAGDARFLRSGLCQPGQGLFAVGPQEMVQLRVTSAMCDMELVLLEAPGSSP